MKKSTTQKKGVTNKAKAVAAKESPILKEVKQLYSFMQDNQLDTCQTFGIAYARTVFACAYSRLPSPAASAFGLITRRKI